jgi:poly(3-hydroxybutyrate) depolymerase
MEAPGTEVVEAAPLRYLLSVPSAPGPRPVLCFLHGYDEAAPMDIRRALTLHGPLRPGNPPLDFIVVAPQLPRAGDVWHRYADDVRGIVSAVQARHDGDAARTYLTGFSFGGNGVFDLALAQPGIWAALWAVDPTRVPQRDPGLPVWLSFGEVARRQTPGFTRVLSLRAEGDRVGLDEGEDHVGSAAHAYRDERIYRWLLANSLPG